MAYPRAGTVLWRARAWPLPLLICLALPGCVKPTSTRPNALRTHFSEAPSGLSAPSKQRAIHYITAWMKIFSVLGTAGLADQARFERAFHDELLPIIQPLRNGDKADQQVFAAAMKVHEALAYLSQRQRSEGGRFDQPELNALLRVSPGDESDPKKISEGAGELFLDFAQWVDPASHAMADFATKLRVR